MICDVLGSGGRNGKRWIFLTSSSRAAKVRVGDLACYIHLNPTFYPIPSKHLITFPSKKYRAFLIFRQSVKKKNIPYFNEFAIDYLYYNIIVC